MNQVSSPEQPRPRSPWESPRLIEVARLTDLTLATGFAQDHRSRAGSTVIP